MTTDEKFEDIIPMRKSNFDRLIKQAREDERKRILEIIDEMKIFRFHEYNGLHKNNRALIKDCIERAVKYYLKQEISKNELQS